jgi:hypothetical protein
VTSSEHQPPPHLSATNTVSLHFTLYSDGDGSAHRRAGRRHRRLYSSSGGGVAGQPRACRPFSPPCPLLLLERGPCRLVHYAEAEFVVSGFPADSYLCYSHVLHALPPDVIAAVRDLVRIVTPDTPGAYTCLKQSLLSRYTPTAIANCFCFIDHPHLGDPHILTLFSDMQALLPADANILFNAHFLRRLLESKQSALVSKGELPPRELAEAAALLPHPALAAAVPVHQTVPLPPSPPPLIAQARPPYRRSQSRSPSRPRRGSSQASSSRSQGRPSMPRPARRQLPQPPPSSTYCFYHYNFGGGARRCQPPCSWHSEN